MSNVTEMTRCESCGKRATVTRDDGSSWCEPCDVAAQRLGYDEEDLDWLPYRLDFAKTTTGTELHLVAVLESSPDRTFCGRDAASIGFDAEEVVLTHLCVICRRALTARRKSLGITDGQGARSEAE